MTLCTLPLLMYFEKPHNKIAMSSTVTDLFSREELLGGLPARRASMALFTIEARAAHFAARAQQAMVRFVTEETFEEQERAFLDAMMRKRDLPSSPSIQDLERFAPDWTPLAPEDPGVRAAVARLIAQKYHLRFRDVPQIRAALGLDEPAVQQAYQRMYGQPLDSIYASRLSFPERIRWVYAHISNRLENLPPFTTAYALTLTETIGSSTLALPIAFAGVGPLAGVALLIILGLINIVTIIGVSEAAIRNGTMRYWGGGYLTELVGSYFGGSGSSVFAIGLVILIFISLISFYLGVSSTLADATGVREEIWALGLFLVNLYFIRRKSIHVTVAFALIVGAINIGLILLLSLLALPHVRLANLLYFNFPFFGGRPLDPSDIKLIFGVVLLAYFGHTSTANCARVVLHREPTGRALVWGNIAAMATAIVLYCIWVISINGALEPQALINETGTVIGPLADKLGTIVEIVGSLYVVLGMGLVSVHFSLGLFNQMREWWPRHIMNSVLDQRGRFWLGMTPIIALFLIIEFMLITNRGTYSGTVGFVGALKGSLLGGIFPMLMLVASRRKGEYVPGISFGLLNYTAVLIGIYLVFLASIFLHGLVIWHDLPAQLAALAVGVVALLMPIVFFHGGMFKRRAIVELRADQTLGHTSAFHIAANGKALTCDVRLKYADREKEMKASDGEIRDFAALRSATFLLPSARAQELKVWVHEINEDGVSQWLPAKVEISNGHGQTITDLIDRERILPLNGDACRVDIQFLPSEEEMAKMFQ
jgi:amino acid permease